ncbi:MAG: inositol monophosphatase [Blastocatellales bacterium]
MRSSANAKQLLEPLRRLHELISREVVAECERSSIESLSTIAMDDEGDTIYAVDRVSEELLIEFCEREIAPLSPIVLIAEGLEDGKIVLPRGTDEADAVWRIIVDPIDGTRPLMYQKRPGWVLTGVAPNRGPGTTLADIELAVQTEIPLVKQHLFDTLYAIRGEGFSAERINRLTGERQAIGLRPSQSSTIAHGYAGIVRLFPGAREVLAAIDEEVAFGALGPVQRDKALCFEDQYSSTGGQLYELMSGHDRFIADLRPLMAPIFEQRGLPLSICCHPYDLCTELIAREAGVIVTGEDGGPLNAPLDLETNVAWIGYSNQKIRELIEPLLRQALKKVESRK